jgi:hypothetical protein
MTTKQRTHNEYFRQVSLGNRKTCPCCKQRLNGKPIWSWGNYINAKWHTVQHFCERCYPEVRERLQLHQAECGCDFQFIGYQGVKLPSWLTLRKS